MSGTRAFPLRHGVRARVAAAHRSPTLPFGSRPAMLPGLELDNEGI
jgi:hypothetical protein